MGPGPERCPGRPEAQSRLRLLHLLVAATRLTPRWEPLRENAHPDIMTYWGHFTEPTRFPWGFPAEGENSHVRASLSCSCSSFANWAHFCQPVSVRGWCLDPQDSTAPASREQSRGHSLPTSLRRASWWQMPSSASSSVVGGKGRPEAGQQDAAGPLLHPSAARVRVPALGEGQHLHVAVFLVLLDIFARPMLSILLTLVH